MHNNFCYIPLHYVCSNAICSMQYAICMFALFYSFVIFLIPNVFQVRSPFCESKHSQFSLLTGFKASNAALKTVGVSMRDVLQAYTLLRLGLRRLSGLSGLSGLRLP